MGLTGINLGSMASEEVKRQSVPREDRQDAVTQYAIPPVVWLFVFLIAGYVGLRFLLE